jgi:hypothetical protein
MNNTLHGTVTVKLGDEEFTLQPTLKAVRAIENRFGGLRGASQTINALSVEGCAIILAAGAGLEGKAAEDVTEKVWQAGVLEVSTQLNAYIVALYNPRGVDKGKDQAGAA